MMNFEIVSASYGVQGGGSQNVTEVVHALAHSANGVIPINNQSMGGDPAYGKLKQLCVDYLDSNGQPQTAVETEGGTINLAGDSGMLGTLMQGLV